MSAARKRRVRARAAGRGRHQQRRCWGGCGAPVGKRAGCCGAMGPEESRATASCRGCGGTGQTCYGVGMWGGRCTGCNGEGWHYVCRRERLDRNGYVAVEHAVTWVEVAPVVRLVAELDRELAGDEAATPF